ncbi:MAG: putative oxidoreductase C-terminal domain-containing protein, partial [Phycisphaerae bacterium]
MTEKCKSLIANRKWRIDKRFATGDLRYAIGNGRSSVMARNVTLFVFGLCLLTIVSSCAEKEEAKMEEATANGKVTLMVLNPGHYHAALVQKSMYDQVSPVVHVYAPAGPEVQQYSKHIQSFNTRPENPTNWQEKVYTGDDYLEKMLAEKPACPELVEGANVVVLAGNNRKKAEYIKAAVDAGINVFSDKPMCIDEDGFKLLQQAFAVAGKKGVLIYDIMTERFNILCILQKMLVLNKEVFGELQTGSVDEPAVVKESVHHFFKYVSGLPIKRPTWYFDTAQQGEGLVDVTTHLIDLAMWTCFPDEKIDYRTDIVMKKARRWPTMINRQQYEKVTGAPDFPDFLKAKLIPKGLNDEGLLPYYSNGEMVYTMKGIAVKISVNWNFQAPEGTKDTHFSIVRGTKANVVIRQGKEQNYRPELYVEPAPGANTEQLAASLKKAVAELQSKYPGLAL